MEARAVVPAAPRIRDRRGTESVPQKAAAVGVGVPLSLRRLRAEVRRVAAASPDGARLGASRPAASSAGAPRPAELAACSALLQRAVLAREGAQRGVLLRVAADEGAPGSRPALDVGSTGAAVRLLQARLGIKVDGVFGPQTQAAVIRYQEARPALHPATGGVGPLTWASLDAENTDEGAVGNRPNLDVGSPNRAAVRLLQERLGIKADGVFGPITHRAVVAFQEAHPALHPATGGVGPGTWAALDSEEGCLLEFKVTVAPATSSATAGPGGITRISGHHVVEARFRSDCDCSRFQYRQFIDGTARATAGAATQDLSTFFANIPGGRLPPASREDGMTQCANGNNYGHREQAGDPTTTAACGENAYRAGRGGRHDQARGCFYRGEDFPKITVRGLPTGANVQLVVNFRGEIQRNGTPIATRRWTDINQNVVTP